MEPENDAGAEARKEVCAAFQALAMVLRVHGLEVSPSGDDRFERFCTAVANLRRRVELPPPREPRTVDHVNSQADVLIAMLERLNVLYDFVESPQNGLSHVAHRLPSRATLPMEDAGLVAFCRVVYDCLLPVPGATTTRGGFAARMRNLYATIKRYDTLGLPPKVVPPVDRAYVEMSAHARGVDECLHLLLVHLDANIYRYAAHISFQDAYHQARMAVMQVTVEARKAYFRRTRPWLEFVE